MKEQFTQQIIDAGRLLYSRGWSPATSSNYSCRLSDNEVLITVSGKHKGQLTVDDVMRINYQGKALEEKNHPPKPCCTRNYNKHKENIGAVFHTHSVQATVLSQLTPGHLLSLNDYELLKAFEDITTHATHVTIPVFDNTQDMVELAEQVASYLQTNPAPLVT